MVLLLLSCKSKDNNSTNPTSGAIIESGNGITYKLYKPADGIYKGILAVGSGNNENAPTEGSLTGSSENLLCQKAADAGYLAAIVKYRANPGTANWNLSAQMMGQDFRNAIEAIALKYGVDKTKSAVGGYSYATYMLYSEISIYSDLTFCKGVLGACGATSEWSAQNFKIPIYAVNCAGNNEGDFNGVALYNKIPSNSPIKALSSGYTDNSCTTHCGGSWEDLMITKLKQWIP